MLGYFADIIRWTSCFLRSGVNDASKPPIRFKQRSSKWFCIFTCSYTVFVDIFLYGAIVPVMPFALMQRVGVAQQNVQHWVSVLLTVYGVALLVASPLCGWWADKTTSRRWPFLSGLILLSGATFMLCFGRTLAVLLVGRVLQGLSAAVVWTVSMCIATDRVGSKEIGLVMGYITLARSLAIVAGPLLGGVVYAQAGYYSVFAMIFGFIGVDFCLRLILIEARIAVKWDPTIIGEYWRGNSSHPADEEKNGQEAYDTQMASIGETADRALTDKLDQGRFYQLVHRLPPLITMMGSIRLDLALWGCFLQALFLCGFDAVLPLFVRNTFHWDSTGAGLIFLALVVPSFISPLIGWLADRHGPRYYAAGGYSLCVPVLVLLRLVTHDSLEQKVLLCALLALLGAFLMCFEIPFWVEIVHVVEEKAQKNPHYYSNGKGAVAQAYGLTNLFFAAGVMVGPVWAGFISEHASWGTMAWTLALLCGVSAVPTLIWTGGPIAKRTPNVVMSTTKTEHPPTELGGGSKTVLRIEEKL